MAEMMVGSNSTLFGLTAPTSPADRTFETQDDRFVRSSSFHDPARWERTASTDVVHNIGGVFVHLLSIKYTVLFLFTAFAAGPSLFVWLSTRWLLDARVDETESIVASSMQVSF